MKVRITLDTNVLISAFFWRGDPYKVMVKCKEGKAELVLSEDILNEFKEVLKREEKFCQTEESIQKHLNVLKRVATIVFPQEKVNVIKEDEMDNRIIECAIAGNASYLVTKDRHLLKLRNYRNIKIVTPQEFLSLFS